jgi:glycosyltransferase involved in cell wall biosynthesis
MRVLVLASWYPTAANPVGGIFVRDQAEVLATSFDVAVIAPAQVARGQLRHVRTIGDPPSDHTDRVVTLRPLAPVMYRSRDVTDRIYAVAVHRAFRRLLRRWGKPDVINVHVVYPAGPAAVALGRRYGIPVVLTEHTGPFSIHLSGPRAVDRVRSVLLGVDRALAVGDRLAAEIRTVADVRVDVIGNVISPAFFETPLPELREGQPLRLLAVGLMTPEKRFDLLVRAFATASRPLTGARLTVVGDGPERGHLIDLARGLGVDAAVEFPGSCTREQIVGLLERSDAFVSSSERESFGLAIAEALASGHPVISTASGGPESFIDSDIGLIVPVNDLDALAEGIGRLPAFLKGFRPEIARDRMAERFGPRKFARRMADILESALETKATGK